MKKKLVHFSGKSVLDIYHELEPLKSNFEVASNSPQLSAAQILKSNNDVIELGPEDFNLFKPHFNSMDLRTSRFGVADILLRFKTDKTDYRPMHILAESVYKAILIKVSALKTSESAVVIGSYDFVLAVTYKLAQSGFFNIVIATYKNSEAEKIKKLIQTYAFNIKISTVALNELTQLESGSVLLISNLEKKINPEAYESITYFNFLSRGAAFVDLNSRNEPTLAEEARRAEILVIEEIEIQKIKYKSILELFKNSPLV